MPERPTAHALDLAGLVSARRYVLLTCPEVGQWCCYVRKLLTVPVVSGRVRVELTNMTLASS